MSPSQTPIHLDDKVIQKALSSDAVAIRIMAKDKFPKAGQLVGIRLNLNVLKSTGVAVQTMHDATNQEGYTKNKGFYHGEAIGYAGAVTLKNAYFNVEQGAREAIAVGLQAKNPMASIDGEFLEAPLDIPLDTLDPTEIRFNPKEVHLFVNMENTAIRRADFVTVVGHRAYAWGDIEYHTEVTAPERAGTFPTRAIVTPEPQLANDTQSTDFSMV